MDRFAVHFTPTLKDHDGFGKFCVQLGGVFFPDKEWTDFGNTVAFTWLKLLTECFEEKAEIASFRFMDGNYRFDLNLQPDSDTAEIALIRDAGGIDDIIGTGLISKTQFASELAAKSTELRDLYRETGVEDASVRIENSLRNLEIAVDQLENPRATTDS